MRIIMVEGIDAVGKATIAKCLVETLDGAGNIVRLFSFPRYDTFEGQQLRAALDSGNHVTEYSRIMNLNILDRAKFFKDNLCEFEDSGIDYLVMDRGYFTNVMYGGGCILANTESQYRSKGFLNGAYIDGHTTPQVDFSIIENLLDNTLTREILDNKLDSDFIESIEIVYLTIDEVTRNLRLSMRGVDDAAECDLYYTRNAHRFLDQLTAYMTECVVNEINIEHRKYFSDNIHYINLKDGTIPINDTVDEIIKSLNIGISKHNADIMSNIIADIKDVAKNITFEPKYGFTDTELKSINDRINDLSVDSGIHIENLKIDKNHITADAIANLTTMRKNAKKNRISLIRDHKTTPNAKNIELTPIDKANDLEKSTQLTGILNEPCDEPRLKTGSELMNRILDGGFENGKLYAIDTPSQLAILSIADNIRFYNPQVEQTCDDKTRCVLVCSYIDDKYFAPVVFSPNATTSPDYGLKAIHVTSNHYPTIETIVRDIKYCNFKCNDIIAVVIDSRHWGRSANKDSMLVDDLKRTAVKYNIPIISSVQYSDKPVHYVMDYTISIKVGSTLYSDLDSKALFARQMNPLTKPSELLTSFNARYNVNNAEYATLGAITQEELSRKSDQTSGDDISIYIGDSHLGKQLPSILENGIVYTVQCEFGNDRLVPLFNLTRGIRKANPHIKQFKCERRRCVLCILTETSTADGINKLYEMHQYYTGVNHGIDIMFKVNSKDTITPEDIHRNVTSLNASGYEIIMVLVDGANQLSEKYQVVHNHLKALVHHLAIPVVLVVQEAAPVDNTDDCSIECHEYVIQVNTIAPYRGEKYSKFSVYRKGEIHPELVHESQTDTVITQLNNIIDLIEREYQYCEVVFDFTHADADSIAVIALRYELNLETNHHTLVFKRGVLESVRALGCDDSVNNEYIAVCNMKYCNMVIDIHDSDWNIIGNPVQCSQFMNSEDGWKYLSNYMREKLPNGTLSINVTAGVSHSLVDYIQHNTISDNGVSEYGDIINSGIPYIIKFKDGVPVKMSFGDIDSIGSTAIEYNFDNIDQSDKYVIDVTLENNIYEFSPGITINSTKPLYYECIGSFYAFDTSHFELFSFAENIIGASIPNAVIEITCDSETLYDICETIDNSQYPQTLDPICEDLDDIIDCNYNYAIDVHYEDAELIGVKISKLYSHMCLEYGRLE